MEKRVGKSTNIQKMHDVLIAQNAFPWSWSDPFLAGFLQSYRHLHKDATYYAYERSKTKNIQVIYGTLNHLSSPNGYFEITIFWMMEDLIHSQECAFWKVFTGQTNYWKRWQAPEDVPLLQASKRGNAWVWFHIVRDYFPESFIICPAPESFPSYYVTKQWGIEKLTTVKTGFFSYGREQYLRACLLDFFLLFLLEGTEGYAFLFR